MAGQPWQPGVSFNAHTLPFQAISEASTFQFQGLSHEDDVELFSRSDSRNFRYNRLQMAAVYKSLSRSDDAKRQDRLKVNGTSKNRQRVLILTSRGVTYRQVARKTEPRSV